MTGLLLFSYIGNEWFDVRNVYPGVDIWGLWAEIHQKRAWDVRKSSGSGLVRFRHRKPLKRATGRKQSLKRFNKKHTTGSNENTDVRHWKEGGEEFCCPAVNDEPGAYHTQSRPQGVMQPALAPVLDSSGVARDTRNSSRLDSIGRDALVKTCTGNALQYDSIVHWTCSPSMCYDLASVGVPARISRYTCTCMHCVCTVTFGAHNPVFEWRLVCCLD